MISQKKYNKIINELLESTIKNEVLNQILITENNLKFAISLTNTKFISNVHKIFLGNIYNFNKKHNLILKNDIDTIVELTKKSIINNFKINKYNLKDVLYYNKKIIKTNKEDYKNIINIMRIKRSINNIKKDLEPIFEIDDYESNKLNIKVKIFFMITLLFLIIFIFYKL